MCYNSLLIYNRLTWTVKVTKYGTVEYYYAIAESCVAFNKMSSFIHAYSHVK